MKRSYYSENFKKFSETDNNQVLGILTKNHRFELDLNQKNAWEEQIKILKKSISKLADGYIAFEFDIPRMGKRIDNILISKGVIFILEFKIGESVFHNKDKVQVEDYALDLKNFHKGSHDKTIVPILIITNGNKTSVKNYEKAQDNIYKPIEAVPEILDKVVLEILGKEKEPNI